ncbi:MAG: hypothetical protein HY695_11850 [Deltaproteobacteria bacterium]|nr:hypothetical protein [Deltaproteobacteria bacterium]
MSKEEFLKRVRVHSRYLTEFLSEGDLEKILETIRNLEKIRQQAEKEKIE